MENHRKCAPQASAVVFHPALLPLVTKELRDGKPPHLLAERICLGPDHTRQRWRHFGSQRDSAASLVLEFVKLSDDLIAAFLGVEDEGLDQLSFLLDSRVALR